MARHLAFRTQTLEASVQETAEGDYVTETNISGGGTSPKASHTDLEQSIESLLCLWQY